MSRVGKKPIIISKDVEVKIDGQHVFVKGPKGTLEEDFHRRVIFEMNEKEIIITVKWPEEKKSRELWGLTRMLVSNMVEGVTKGFEKQLEINGVGYKAECTGRKITIHAGYSHPVDLEFPEGIEAKVEKNIITVSGINKQEVGQFAAQIREVRKPEPYKGKGIKYVKETIRRKAGKVVKAAGA